MNIYLQLEAATGNLFEFSKEPKDGYEKHTSPAKNDKPETVSYRKYYKEGIFGKLLSIAKREGKMGDKTIMNISTVIEDIYGDRYFINFPLKNAKGDIQDYAISLIAKMPFLKAGNPYKFFPYVLEVDAKDGKPARKNYGISIKHARLSDNAVDDVNKIQQLTFEVADKDGNITKAGEIPRTEWEMVADAPKANNNKRTSYLWNVLVEHEVGDANVGGTKKTFDSTTEQDAEIPTGQAKPEPVAAEAPQVKEEKAAPEKAKGMAPNTEFDSQIGKPVATAIADISEEDEDDLPFNEEL